MSLLSTLVLNTILHPGYIYLTEVKNWNRSLQQYYYFSFFRHRNYSSILCLSSMVIEKTTELKNNQIYSKNLIYKLQHLLRVGGKVQQIIEDGLKSAGTRATELFTSVISGVFNVILGLLLFFLLYLCW